MVDGVARSRDAVERANGVLDRCTDLAAPVPRPGPDRGGQPGHDTVDIDIDIDIDIDSGGDDGVGAIRAFRTGRTVHWYGGYETSRLSGWGVPRYLQSPRVSSGPGESGPGNPATHGVRPRPRPHLP
ncbi:hypothetical protein ACFU51_21975 [Streptomyces sp. NPDC057430]|uniref:hypothetical protein n=1 Tax=Streptomyces sp. NPDC057430 TaxID=3346131 RepID=UPI0036C86BA5